MPASCLAECLGRLCELTDEEHDALREVEGVRRQVRRGTVLRGEREAGSEMFVVLSGWLFGSMLLEDGRRQILRFHFRGDLLGGDLLGFREAPDATTALTDAEIAVIDPVSFGRLFANQPRLAALFYVSLQAERVALTDRLTSLGRSSAKGRVAALLLWLVERLRVSNPATGNDFVLPMTQEEIGDATGLTGVHVNRTLRALERDGLIDRTRNILSLKDPQRLAAIANRPVRTERILPGWLPAPTEGVSA